MPFFPDMSQVPPAIRWEVGLNPENVYYNSQLDMLTHERLSERTFGISPTAPKTATQHRYCDEYYNAMVEPFTDNRRWYKLLHAANSTWCRIFFKFENLESISVGCCERVDQPRPTCTNTFVLEHGRSVIEDVQPPFVEDATVNMGWASAIIFRVAPSTVQSLQLSMANLDNFNTVATVNRLLSLSYRNLHPGYMHNVTRLSLTLGGVTGVHGAQDWSGDTGSAGLVRHWKKELNSMRCLQHLELRDASNLENVPFSDLENTDLCATILDWLLPDLILDQLRTLRLCNFLLNRATVETTLSGYWPQLENLILEDIQLFLRRDETTGYGERYLQCVQGRSWLETCRALASKLPCRIFLIRPVSILVGAEEYELESSYVEQIRQLPSVTLEA